MEVKACFTNGNNLCLLGQILQATVCFSGEILRIVRMDADRARDTVILICECNTLQCTIEVGADRDERFNACCPGTSVDFVPVLVKLLHLDMTVGIDKCRWRSICRICRNGCRLFFCIAAFHSGPISCTGSSARELATGVMRRTS